MDFNLTTELAEAIVPQATSTYQPIGHEELIHELYETLAARGYTVKNLRTSGAAQGRKMVGTVTIDKGDDLIDLTVGFRNSYDKSLSVGLGLGANVVVCNNGMFVADVQTLRKHTTNVWGDVKDIMARQINRVDEFYDMILTDIMEFKTTPVTLHDISLTAGRLFIEDKSLNTKQMNDFKRELTNSENFAMIHKHGWQMETEMTAWNLYNNLTEVLKDSHPTGFFKNHAAVHNRVLELC